MVTGVGHDESVWYLNRTRCATALVMGVVFLSLLVVGCQTSGTTQKPQWSAAPIESFASVVGKWGGLMVSEPKSRFDDWVRLSIGRDGRYTFTSYRTIGVFSGQGQFDLVNGKLTVMTERGLATGSLLVSDGARMLRFLAVMKDGTEYTVELDPAK
ncbi:hypothetical protein [Petrachloros mirabilis]